MLSRLTCAIAAWKASNTELYLPGLVQNSTRQGGRRVSVGRENKDEHWLGLKPCKGGLGLPILYIKRE